MDLTSLIVQVIAGAVGGSAAGAAAKDYSLGTLGNAIAGAIRCRPVSRHVRCQAVESYVGSIAGGAVGGAILMILAGVIRNMTAK